MFGGSPETSGFLDIQWADIVYIVVLKGTIRFVICLLSEVPKNKIFTSCVIASNLVRMTVGDILR